MLSWFQVMHVHGLVLHVPVFVWANTAFYARERASMRFGVSAQSIVMKAVGDPATFPSGSVELVESDDIGVEERPLRRKGELRAKPATKKSEAERLHRILTIARAILVPPTKRRKRKRKPAKVSKKRGAKR